MAARRGRQANEQGAIAQVMAEGAADAALEIGRGCGEVGEAGSRLHQGQPCHLDQIVALEEIGEAAMEAAGEAVGQGKKAQNSGVTPGDGAVHGNAQKALHKAPRGGGF